MVPAGSLTALPFHLLVTEKPAAAALRRCKILGPYRDAAWLLRRHAVTVLPSVGSLKALRTVATRSDPGKAVRRIWRSAVPELARRRRAISAAPARSPATRGYADLWNARGAVDRGKLADALPRLEDTADRDQELSPPRSVHPLPISILGEAASETKVKQTTLSGYRVVYFATHGLVAGEVRGVGEPALALTHSIQPPRREMTDYSPQAKSPSSS